MDANTPINITEKEFTIEPSAEFEAYVQNIGCENVTLTLNVLAEGLETAQKFKYFKTENGVDYFCPDNSDDWISVEMTPENKLRFVLGKETLSNELEIEIAAAVPATTTRTLIPETTITVDELIEDEYGNVYAPLSGNIWNASYIHLSGSYNRHAFAADYVLKNGGVALRVEGAMAGVIYQPSEEGSVGFCPNDLDSFETLTITAWATEAETEAVWAKAAGTAVFYTNGYGSSLYNTIVPYYDEGMTESVETDPTAFVAAMESGGAVIRNNVNGATYYPLWWNGSGAAFAVGGDNGTLTVGYFSKQTPTS